MKKSLNDITKEDFDLIEVLGGCFFSPEETALICEIDEAFFIAAVKDKSSTIYRSYQKGLLQSEFNLRKCIIQLAISGSSPAQTAALQLRENALLKSLD